MGGAWLWRWMGRWLLVLAAMGSASGAALPALAEDWQPPTTVYVEAAGHTVDGLFLDLWRDRQELTGDPITEEFAARPAFVADDSGSIVQYYENVAFLYDPNAAGDEVVRLLDLGRQHLASLLDESPIASLRTAAEPTICAASTADCLDVPGADHTVRGPLRAFWEETGGADWIGPPITEAYRAPDGSYVQFFERGALHLGRDGEVAPLPLGRIFAGARDLETDPIAPPAGVPVYDEALFVAPAEPEPEPEPEPALAPDPEPELALANADSPFAVRTYGPGPQQGAWKEIVVSLSQQAMWAYEGGEVVAATLVSTGTGAVPEAVTPVGSFQILTKYDIQDMEGNIGGYYFVPDVPNVMYFDNLGNALHGTYWHSNFGTPMSHGCVNLPLDVAAWLYQWAPVGTAVTVVP